jgi:hypothetical protein
VQQPVDPTAALRAQFRGSSHRVPGGVFETARASRGASPFDEEYAEQLDETADQQRMAEHYRVMMEKQGLEAQATVQEGLIQSQRDDLEQKQARRIQINAEINRRMDNIDARRAEYEASNEVDPQRYFKSLGTVGGALAAIGLLGTAFTSGYNGERNPVMDMYQANVERDLAIQREELAKKKGGITGEENALARFVNIHGDPQIAENEFRLHALDIADRQAKLLATRSQSQMAEANYDKFVVDLNAKRDQIKAEMRAQAQGQVDRQFTVTQDRVVGMSGQDQYKRFIKGEAEITEAERKAGMRPDPGSDTNAIYWPTTGQVIGHAKTTDEKAEEVRKVVAGAANIDRLAASTAARMRNWEDLKPSERGKLLADAGALMLEMKGPAGADLGVLAGPDLDVLDNVVVANPGSLGDAATRSIVIDKLEQTRRNVRAKGDIFLGAHGIRPAPWDSGDLGERR